MRFCSLFVVLMCVFPLFSQWSLPYLRPEAYDYSQYYGADLISYQSSNPMGFQQELARAWSFYKSTFIMSNGLVNHSRWDNNSAQVVGTNEAVSEGQGYGMLLALINNDQPTFNRIFEAANQYLWNGSSYTWKWNEGSGSATDADLDIGLALIFADRLADKGLWNSYNSNGITYQSRAIQVIGQIKNKMTCNGYLLPGDNWGECGGIDQQNPSYYAVAWMKIFNQYQNQHDFTAVIDNCYQVLSRAPRYNIGQVPNWMTRNGGYANPGQVSDNNPYGMGNDAIRTPWRIAMDALWFNDPRAMEYCRNIKRTLTTYPSSSVALLGQMGLYDDGGNLIQNTIGSPGNVAMWAVGILGSREEDFTTQALKGRIIAQITGTSKDFFGDAALKDDKFYYIQSLSMLGFAACTGQFPNVYADMQGDITTGIKLVDPLAVNIAAIFFPENVEFNARIAEPAPWTLTLTGQSSGISTTFNGNNADITVTWNGEGFTQKELVVAELTVQGLEYQADPNVLRVNMQILSPYTTGLAGKASGSVFSIAPHGSGNDLEIRMPATEMEPVAVTLYSFKGTRSQTVSDLKKTGPCRWIVPVNAPDMEPGIYYGAVTYRNGNTVESFMQRILYGF